MSGACKVVVWQLVGNKLIRRETCLNEALAVGTQACSWYNDSGGSKLVLVMALESPSRVCGLHSAVVVL